MAVNNGERLNALENSHRAVHAKLDQLVQAMGAGAPPGLIVDAKGQPIYPGAPTPVPEPNERIATAVATSDSTTNLLAVLLPFLKQPAPVAPPPSPWAGVIELIIPVLVEKLLDRPDPIAQFAAMKDLIEPGMTDQVMAATLPTLMPAVIAKMMGGAGEGKSGAKPGEMTDAFKQALGDIDPEDLFKLIASQAKADGGDSAS